jgi:hypothetical protein
MNPENVALWIRQPFKDVARSILPMYTVTPR